jgi:lactate racemase
MKTMQVSLKYGGGALALDIPEQITRVAVLEPGRTALPTREECAGPSPDEAELIRASLAQPIDSLRLSQLVCGRERVVVVTSDITRSCPSARLLPHVLDELNRGGVCDENVTVVFGLGTHRPHTQAEQIALVGEQTYQRVRCIDSNPEDVVLMGHTERGTPVAVFSPVFGADVRVCLGAIEYHYFAGYSGGAKAIMPGVSNGEAIQHNHRMMTDPGACSGRLGDNPVRMDIDEAGRMVGIHFILNVILDEAKRVVHAVSGHAQAAHRAGCARLDGFGRATVSEPADLVIVSAGGHPKDINLYQAQKALDNARMVVRPGGVILLVAECREGMGSRVFEEWMRDPGGPDAIIAHIQREFVLGGHKAAAVAMAMKQATIYLVSALPADDAHAMGFHPFGGLDEALRSALARVGHSPNVVVMPEGGSVLPAVVPYLRKGAVA